MEGQSSNEGSTSTNVSPHSSDSTVELNIKTLDSRNYTFQLQKNVIINPTIPSSFHSLHYSSIISSFLLFQMPVSLFKQKIADQIGLPVHHQRLIFRGKVLKDEHLLSDYRILQILHHYLLLCFLNMWISRSNTVSLLQLEFHVSFNSFLFVWIILSC